VHDCMKNTVPCKLIKLLLLFPPERIDGSHYFQKNIPYGIALLKGYLKKEGYSNTTIYNFTSKKSGLNKWWQQFKKYIYYFLFIKIKGKCLKADRGREHLFVRQDNDVDFSDMARSTISLNMSFYKGIHDVVDKKGILFRDACQLLKEELPEVVGISVMYFHQLYYSLQIAKIVKYIKSDIIVVFGGALITKNEQFFRKKSDAVDFIDGYILGFGEQPLLRLLECVNDGKPLSNVPNYIYKKGLVYKKSNVSLIYDEVYLQTIPEFNKGFVPDAIPIRVSHGCYWGRCSFCTYCINDVAYHMLSAEEAVKIISLLIDKYNRRRFYFVDNALPPMFLKTISELLIEKNIHISWTVRVCFDRAFSNKSLPMLMKKAGCRRVYLGLESIVPRILSLMGKMQNYEDIIPIIQSFSNASIPMQLFAIFGFPTETKEEATETLNFLLYCVKNYLVDIIDCERFMLEENTTIYRFPKKYGIKNIDKRDKGIGLRLGYSYEVYFGMSNEELNQFYREAYFLFSQNNSSVLSSDFNE
jgi:radical SAM superfamily enzyme YgiQ (UPF0313 family)